MIKGEKRNMEKIRVGMLTVAVWMTMCGLCF